MIDNTTWLDVDLSVPPEGCGTGLIDAPESWLVQREKDLGLFGDVFPALMVPRSEWQNRSQRLAQTYRNDITKIYSQGQEGSCVGFASAQMLETALRRRYGIQNWVSLSGMSVYKRIGNSAQSGAMVPDGMDAVIEGVLPVNSDENKAKYLHTHPRTGFGQPLPNGWRDTAKLFRGTHFVVARGIDQIASALLCGFPGIVGRQGHSIPYVYLDYTSAGRPVAAYANSWGTWGDQGFGYDSENILNGITVWFLVGVVSRPDLGTPEVV